MNNSDSPNSRDKKSRRPSSEKPTRTRSNSNVSNGTVPAYTNNNEDLQPLLRKVQGFRFTRMSWMVNCTFLVSVLVLIAGLTTLGLSISSFTYTIIFPYHNYFTVEYNADDGYSIPSGVAVSSISGQIRAGSGFEFMYQRVTDEKLPSYPTQVQTFSYFPSNSKYVYFSIFITHRLVLVYNANDDGRLFTTVLDDKTLISNATIFSGNSTPNIFDSQPVGHDRFVTLFSETTPTNFTLFIQMGQITDTIQTQQPFPIVQTNGTFEQFAYFSVLPNNRYSVMFHMETEENTGCVNYLLLYNQTISQWSLLDTRYLVAPCRSGNITPLSGYRVLIATENDVRVIENSADKIQPISAVVKFSCRPSFKVESAIRSQIDIQSTSTHGFILSCTWFRSASMLYGAIRYGNDIRLELGKFAEFDTVRPGSVKLNRALENRDNGVFATYRSYNSGQYQTIRCAVMETYQGLFVTFSKPYVHMTYPVDKDVPANVAGVSQYGVLFASGDSSRFGVFDLELAKWNGGIKWIGISQGSSSSTTGATKIVQKGIATGLSGLIPGSSYYADVHGQLTLLKTDTYVGIARTSSELMIDDDFVR